MKISYCLSIAVVALGFSLSASAEEVDFQKLEACFNSTSTPIKNVSKLIYPPQTHFVSNLQKNATTGPVQTFNTLLFADPTDQGLDLKVIQRGKNGKLTGKSYSIPKNQTLSRTCADSPRIEIDAESVCPDKGSPCPKTPMSVSWESVTNSGLQFAKMCPPELAIAKAGVKILSAPPSTPLNEESAKQAAIEGLTKRLEFLSDHHSRWPIALGIQRLSYPTILAAIKPDGVCSKAIQPTPVGIEQKAFQLFCKMEPRDPACVSDNPFVKPPDVETEA